MPPLHPLVIHFPIALFCVAVLFDAISTFTKKPTLVAATRILMALSVVGTIVALITGEMLKAQRSGFLPSNLLHLHQTLAIVFCIYAVGIAAIRLRSAWRPSLGYLSLAVVGVGLLSAVGHTGGMMAWPSVTPPVAIAGGGGSGASGSGLSGSGKSTAGHSTSGQSAQHISLSQQPGGKDRSTGLGGAVGSGSSKHGAVKRGSSSTTASAQPDKVLYQVGSSGSAVSTLQQALGKLGYFHHALTTYYGSVTDQAVKDFQGQNRLPATGTVDTRTMTALEQKSGVQMSTDTSSPSASSTSGTSGTSGGTSTPTVNQVRYQDGLTFFTQYCQSCHSLWKAEQYYGQLSQSQWQTIVDNMNAQAGGTIPHTADIVYYLSHHP